MLTRSVSCRIEGGQVGERGAAWGHVLLWLQMFMELASFVHVECLLTSQDVSQGLGESAQLALQGESSVFVHEAVEEIMMHCFLPMSA